MSDSQKWFLLVGIILVGWLLIQLSGMLMPFIGGFILAYFGVPLVDKLEKKSKLPRVFAVLIVFLVLLMGSLVLMIILLPLFEQQFGSLLTNLSGWMDNFQQQLVPKIFRSLGISPSASYSRAFQIAIIKHWQDAGGMVTSFFSYISTSGFSLITWLVNLLLTPIITFYLLVDWHTLFQRLRQLLPLKYEPTFIDIINQCDTVLAAFLRGQLLVMLCLGTIYTIGLWLIGLNYSLLIGVLAGLLTFVPYLGFSVGMVSALITAFFQFQEIVPMLWVLIVFGTGQLIDAAFLTPFLVGEKIGLHPIAVIFAILAGGQLFGFSGVLLALPIASVLVVLLNHAHQIYITSEFYKQD